MAHRFPVGALRIYSITERDKEANVEDMMYSGDRKTRARIDYDPDPSYDIPASFPVIRFDEYRGRLETGHGDGFDPSVVSRAWSHFRDMNLVVRYLRMFHGALAVETVQLPAWNQDGFCLVATPEAVAEFCGTADAVRKEWVESSLAIDARTCQYWLEGEVYGYVIDVLREGVKVYADGREEPFTEWEATDSCWGYFGEDDVRSVLKDEYDLE